MVLISFAVRNVIRTTTAVRRANANYSEWMKNKILKNKSPSESFFEWQTVSPCRSIFFRSVRLKTRKRACKGRRESRTKLARGTLFSLFLLLHNALFPEDIHYVTSDLTRPKENKKKTPDENTSTPLKKFCARGIIAYRRIIIIIIAWGFHFFSFIYISLEYSVRRVFGPSP